MYESEGYTAQNAGLKLIEVIIYFKLFISFILTAESQIENFVINFDWLRNLDAVVTNFVNKSAQA